MFRIPSALPPTPLALRRAPEMPDYQHGEDRTAYDKHGRRFVARIVSLRKEDTCGVEREDASDAQ